MTNGRGMMRFSRGFMAFAKRLPVVPVALRARLPWGLHTHTLTSSFAANMFWFCFAPWVRLDATVLPPLRFDGVGFPHGPADIPAYNHSMLPEKKYAPKQSLGVPMRHARSASGVPSACCRRQAVSSRLRCVSGALGRCKCSAGQLCRQAD